MDGATYAGELRTPLLRRIQEQLRAEVDPGFGFVTPGAPSWTPFVKPLQDARVALVTTAGLHLLGDAPFRALEERMGDTSFRCIPHVASDEELALDAAYVEQKFTPSDSEVALPRRALDALHAAGQIGAPCERHYSFVGGIIRPLPGLLESAELLLQFLREDQADAVVVLPTCSLCVQTGAILARQIEAAGLPSVCLSLLPELSEIVRVPRTLHVHFPFGAPMGDPGNKYLQQAVLKAALDCLVQAQQPESVTTCELKWRR